MIMRLKLRRLVSGQRLLPSIKIQGKVNWNILNCHQFSDPVTNVYGFGVLLLELISGKLPYSDEQGPIVNWAAEYLNDRQKFGNMIDPMLKSFKNNELDIICEVIQDCIQRDMRKRPTMKEVTSKRREVMLYHPMQQLQDSLPSGGPNLRSYPWRQLKIRFEIFFIPCLSLTYSKENCLKMQFKP